MRRAIFQRSPKNVKCPSLSNYRRDVFYPHLVGDEEHIGTNHSWCSIIQYPGIEPFGRKVL